MRTMPVRAPRMRSPHGQSALRHGRSELILESISGDPDRPSHRKCGKKKPTRSTTQEFDHVGLLVDGPPPLAGYASPSTNTTTNYCTASYWGMQVIIVKMSGQVACLMRPGSAASLFLREGRVCPRLAVKSQGEIEPAICEE